MANKTNLSIIKVKVIGGIIKITMESLNVKEAFLSMKGKKR